MCTSRPSFRRLVVRSIGRDQVFNTGRLPGRPPTHIVLEIDGGTAFWLAAGDRQWIDLQSPLQRPAAGLRSAGLADIAGRIRSALLCFSMTRRFPEKQGTLRAGLCRPALTWASCRRILIGEDI
jgi:hypothetical protein